MAADAYSSCTINESPAHERKTLTKGMLGNVTMKTTWSRLRCEMGQRKGNRQRMERAGERRRGEECRNAWWEDQKAAAGQMNMSITAAAARQGMGSLPVQLLCWKISDSSQYLLISVLLHLFGNRLKATECNQTPHHIWDARPRASEQMQVYSSEDDDVEAEERKRDGQVEFFTWFLKRTELRSPWRKEGQHHASVRGFAGCFAK